MKSAFNKAHAALRMTHMAVLATAEQAVSAIRDEGDILNTEEAEGTLQDLRETLDYAIELLNCLQREHEAFTDLEPRDDSERVLDGIARAMDMRASA